MRWAFSGLNLSLAAIAELAGYFLSCPLLRNGDRLHGARWRLFACSHRRHFRRRYGWRLGRSFLLREALLESFHQINHRRQMRLGNFGALLPLELSRDHRAHILLGFLAILLRVDLGAEPFK